MAYWLIKSEPGVFSIDDLAGAKDKTTAWDGVRNYQARNNLRAMRKGDLALFYHSNADPSAAVGVVEVVREAYPDGSPTWSKVDVRLVEKFARPMTLEMFKREPALKEMALLKQGRLSVQPVRPREWRVVTSCATSR